MATNDRPNVLVISLDTTRADRIGTYGYALARTPTIDRLAAEGVRCDDAITPVPITLPSHSTMFTGLYPPAHGVRDNGAYALGEDTVTMAEIFKKAGYDTAAFVSALVLNRKYNLDQGFDVYDDDLSEEDQPAMFMIRDRPAPKTAALATAWLDERKAKKAENPFFMWVHFFDPHQPWESKVKNKWIIPTEYDAEIAQADNGVGAIIAKLEETRRLDDTIVVIVGDHGESLGEHGETTHALFIYDATLSVPLIFRYPAALPSGRPYSAPVVTADILPTVLRLAGRDPAEGIQGVDLTDALNGRSELGPRSIYCESLLSEVGFGMAPLHGVRDGRYKYIRAPRPELYDLEDDPRELENVVGADEARSKKMDEAISSLLKESEKLSVKTTANPLNKETEEMLQALGYLVPEEQRKDMGGMDPKDGIVLHNALQRVRNLARKQRWKTAEEESRRILEKTPRNVSARNVLGLTLTKQDRLDDAQKEYERSLEIDPKQHRVLSSLALIAIRKKDLEAAKKHLTRSLELVPEYVESMVQLGFIEASSGNREASEEWYRKAMKADPSYPDLYRRYGDLYFMQEKYEEALASYEKMLEKVPSSFQALIQAGVSAKRLGRTVDAIGFLDRAGELRNDSWIPPYNLACIRSLDGDGPGALALLEEAAKRAPTSKRLLNALKNDEDLTAARAVEGFDRLITSLEDPPQNQQQ